MEYEKFVANLFSKTKTKSTMIWQGNLNRPKSLQKFYNYPDRHFKIIHVGGTNGKGSVCQKISEYLKKSNFKVGLFTSPHIYDFTERIQINNKNISKFDVLRIFPKILHETKHINPSFFEFMTIAAFLYFKRHCVDYAVVEVGVGGKADATNVITPILSVITSISLDHTKILGETIEQITAEKAGIIKPKIPVIIGPTVNEKIIKKVALKTQSEIHVVKGNFQNFDLENRQISKKSIELITKIEKLKMNKLTLKIALNTNPPCRMQQMSISNKILILDVAHNSAALKKLIFSLEQKFPLKKFEFLLAISKKKNFNSFKKIFEENFDENFIKNDEKLIKNGKFNEKLIKNDKFDENLKNKKNEKSVIKVKFVANSNSDKNGRILGHDELFSLHKQFNNNNIFEYSFEGNLMQNLKKSLENENSIIVITGSFFIMEEARKCIKLLKNKS